MTEKAGALSLSYGRQRPVELTPVAPDSFIIPVLNGTVAFTAEQRRRITALLLEQEGSTVTAERDSP